MTGKISLLMLMCILTSCNLPMEPLPPLSTPTLESPTMAFTSPAPLTATFTPAPTETPTKEISSFCNDASPKELIPTLEQAFKLKDGQLLSASVSPLHGMDVMFYRDGKAIHYDNEQAKFLFETTYQADWGVSFGSGETTLGSFHDIVLPSLQFVLSNISALGCNELLYGGVTYTPEWPYPGTDYYSVHYAGTDQYGGLDWQTWALGMETIEGKPYVRSLVHYVWEP